MNSIMNVTPTPVSDVASIENKHLLWAILTEEQVFDGIREDRAPAIINIFETAINTVKNTRTNTTDDAASAANLAAINKDVIRRVIADIARYKSSLEFGNDADATETKYKAADMHESRIRDITSKLKLHEDDMKSFLVLKKPAEINFADARADDDRPIGEEMDQLIQAALASRARELEIMQIQNSPPQLPQLHGATPPTPITPNPTPTHSSSITNDKKTVSFTSTIIGDGVDADDSVTNIETGAETTFNIRSIVNKLKRNAATSADPKVNDNDVLQTLMRSITDIQRDLRDIKMILHTNKNA